MTGPHDDPPADPAEPGRGGRHASVDDARLHEGERLVAPPTPPTPPDGMQSVDAANDPAGLTAQPGSSATPGSAARAAPAPPPESSSPPSMPSASSAPPPPSDSAAPGEPPAYPVLNAPPASPAAATHVPRHGDPAYVGTHRLPPERMRARRTTTTIAIAAGAVAIVLIAGLFAAGRLWADTGGGAAAAVSPTSSPPASTPSATPTPTPAPEPTVGTVPTAAAAPGLQPWTALAGGECLTGYTSPFAEEFTVVDCASEHTAQLVATGLFAGDPGTTYPGEAELASRMNLLCTDPAVLDRAAAAAIADLQWQPAYPLEAAWNDGDRRWFCFFSSNSGAPLPVSLVPAVG
ncbi:septum formation family protein [Herbiconiux moechotypicola]|uniref:Septum formation-related domain-containing protein n=1 Tax=Herbiconiux moechotypicola TaxID=637393 RepID=A0ABN3D9Z5_9MICO|nr:septum formation family protein [Herbiconiux moechotypicola]MCS5729067.1 septum formation family protein [Herbiconiux moechotypicola]